MSLAKPQARANWRRRRRELFAKLMAPPPRLTVSEWADRYRVLSRENCAEPGPWRTDRVPYMREIMDTACDPTIEEVVFKKSAQIAATEAANNIIGYYMDQDPSPIMVVQTTEGEAEKYSKEKLAPMLRDSPQLARLFEHVKTRDSDNTILSKWYLGGHLGIVGANAPSGLRMRSRRIVIFDEFAGYPDSAGAEGDPVMLGKARAQTFWNRKFFLFSTPTVKGDRVDRAYEASDQRRYHVACPHCGTRQVLLFKQLVWEKREYKLGGEPTDVPAEFGAPVHRWDLKKDTATAHYPETAQYACTQCGGVIDEGDKLGMLAGGQWGAAFPGRRVRGYHINALYSPWVRWSEIAREFLETLSHPEKLRPFINLKLGENFEDRQDGITADVMADRCEPYAAEVPAGVGVLTAAVDTQDDRLELKVKGWGAEYESWLITLKTFDGDPAQPDVWNRLDEELIRGYEHEEGALLKIRSVTIDTGGHHADAVYRFARSRRNRAIYAIKGSSTPGDPIWPARRPKPGKYGVRVWLVGTDTAKDVILLSRIKRAVAGPGCMHFPEGTPAEYFEQLTAEAKVPVKTARGNVLRWQKKHSGVRNEALDLEVYNLAALLALGRTTHEHLDRAVARTVAEGAKRRALLADGEVAANTEEPETPRAKRRRRRGWVTNW